MLLLAAVLTTAGCAPEADEQEAVQRTLRGRMVNAEAASYLERAHHAFERGDYGTVLALADSAERYTPELADIPFLRGRVYTELNRFEEADAAYRETLARDPYFRGVYFKLGNNAFLQGRYREAVVLYRQEKELMARSPEAVRAAYRDVDRAALPAVLLQVGRSYKLLGEPDSARTAYRQALGADSTSAQAYAWLGELAEEEGELERALTYAREALALEPANPEYQYQAGSLLNSLGRAQEAIPLLERTFRQQPWHEGANYNLGQALLRSGQPEAAQRYLARADTLQKLNAEIASAQAAAYKQPDAPRRWVALARILLQAGRLDEAAQAFGAALYLRPDDLTLQNDMANLALARGDTTGAVLRYRALLRQDSTFADGWLNLGVVHALSGRYDEARRAWEQALRSDPAHPEARAYLARLDAME